MEAVEGIPEAAAGLTRFIGERDTPHLETASIMQFQKLGNDACNDVVAKIRGQIRDANAVAKSVDDRTQRLFGRFDPIGNEEAGARELNIGRGGYRKQRERIARVGPLGDGSDQLRAFLVEIIPIADLQFCAKP
jgi:hypothetical protein